MDHKPLKLAIAGGGVGGLMLALCLGKLIPECRSHLDIDIYESTSSLKAQIGAGIGVWPLVWGVFRELGMDEELLKLSLSPKTDGPVKTLLFRKADQVPAKDLFSLTSTSGSIIHFHRGDFQAVLLKHLPPWVNVHTRKRLRSYVQNSEGVVIQFEDGATAKADILIGADGLQSNVRRRLVEEIDGGLEESKNGHLTDPRWTGFVCYRELIPRQKLVEQGYADHRAFKGWSLYTGKGGEVMAYPISNGAFVNFVAQRFWPDYENTRYRDDVLANILKAEGYERPVTSVATDQNKALEGDVWSMEGGETINGKRQRWFTRVSPEEVKYNYASWEPEVQVLLNNLTSPLAWAIHTVGKLDTFSHHRVCLLGDSAHAMRPNHGAGACMAICDSYILAHLFASAIQINHTRLRSKAEVLLDVYDKIRRPDAQHVASASRGGNYHHGLRFAPKGDEDKARFVDTDSDEDLKRFQEEVTNGWSYVWDRERLPAAVDQAVSMLQEKY